MSPRNTTAVLLTLSLSAMLTVVSGQGHGAAQTDDSQGSPVLELDVVMARVGPVEITRAIHLEEVNRLIPLNYFHAKVAPGQRRELEVQALDSLIEKSLIHQDARQRGLKASQEEVRAEFRKTLQKAGPRFANVSPEEFEKLLEEHRPRVVRRVLLDKNEARFEASVPATTEEDLRRYYEENRGLLLSPDRARFLHILSKVAPTAGAREAQEVFERMEGIAREIEAGTPFEVLARAHSEDIYASRGGDMGFVESGAFLNQGIGEKAFALQDGETSEILTSIYGYHIVRRMESEPRRALTFEEARSAVHLQVTADLRHRHRRAWLSGARSAFPVEILVDLKPPPVDVASPGEKHGGRP